ncbi:MAG: hypothetical protein ACKERG_03395 [Candidatus Hodgkinia cicadicola]
MIAVLLLDAQLRLRLSCWFEVSKLGRELPSEAGDCGSYLCLRWLPPAVFRLRVAADVDLPSLLEAAGSLGTAQLSLAPIRSCAPVKTKSWPQPFCAARLALKLDASVGWGSKVWMQARGVSGWGGGERRGAEKWHTHTHVAHLWSADDTSCCSQFEAVSFNAASRQLLSIVRVLSFSVIERKLCNHRTLAIPTPPTVVSCNICAVISTTRRRLTNPPLPSASEVLAAY